MEILDKQEQEVQRKPERRTSCDRRDNYWPCIDICRHYSHFFQRGMDPLCSQKNIAVMANASYRFGGCVLGKKADLTGVILLCIGVLYFYYPG